MFSVIMITMLTAATAGYRCGYPGECQGLAQDYLTSVPSLTTCQQRCNNDLQCQYFSYNINPSNYLYRHCFLYKECQLGPDSSDWVTYSSLCRGYYLSYIHRLRMMHMKNHYKKQYLYG